MATFTLNGYDSYSGCDIIVTARLNTITDLKKEIKEKTYTLGSLQTLSVSTHQDKKPVRVIGSVNALDYTMGQRTIAGSLVFAVFDQHFATEMFNDLSEATGKTFFLPDELPAIDLTISFANEYGKKSRMAIYGVRIINEGQVMSINDLYTENTYQFVATAMEPLKKGQDIASNNNSNASQMNIASSIEINDVNMSNLGEEIYNNVRGFSLQNFNRITLTAIVEQPHYSSEEGIAKFNLSPNQTSGVIYVFDKKKDKVIREIQITQENIYHSIFLTKGNYSAWYENNEETLSNTVDFNIVSNMKFNIVADDTPIIDDLTKNSISITSNNPSHTTGVILNIENFESIEIDLKSRKCTFENLNPNTQYRVYTKADNNHSKNLEAITLKEEYDFISSYKDYVEYNSNLLSKDFSYYKEILNGIKDIDILNDLNKVKEQEAKELIFMAIKFKNEFIASINSDNYSTPKKKIDNVYGNSFEFNTGISKANIFFNKNKKDYFESSQLYPTQIDYVGKPNTIYSVVGITNDYIKSPKYYFYSFSDNDKEIINKSFGNVDKLSNLNNNVVRNLRLSNEAMKCLTAKEYKQIDIDLLKAPTLIMNDSNNIVVDTNYAEILGVKNNNYYVCVSKLDEALDSTPVKKIKINDSSNNIIIDSYSLYINNEDIYCVWIEDDRFNVISEMAFVSSLEDIIQVNNYLIEREIDSITKKIETAIKKPGYLNDLKLYINTQEISFKNIYYEMACALIKFNENDALYLINELFKIYFNGVCINREKYKYVTYDNKNKVINFDNNDENNNVDLIRISFKKDDYKIASMKNSMDIIDNDYDINLYYLISSNPVIKSGYVLINNNKYLSYLIEVEEK